MKIRIQLKSPDAIHYALQDVDEEHRDSVEETLEKWLQYGENAYR